MEVLVAGAGLAGLRTAGLLARAGVDVVVHEAADRPGGRVATDRVDGFTLDRGFQLYNTAYSEGRAALDVPALALRSFPRGVEVLLADDARVRLDDPREALSAVPTDVGTVLAGRAGMPWQWAALGVYVAGCAARTDEQLALRPDLSIERALARAGVTGRALDRVVAPFLAGVLGDESLATSRRYVDQVLRTFAVGRPSLPTLGMAAIADQLAQHLPAGALRLSDGVVRIGSGEVVTDSGTFRPRAVVVATAAPAAAHLLPGLAVPAMRSLSTWYFSTSALRHGEHARLALDGRARRWLANVAVPTDIVPQYGPGPSLVAASAVGYHPDGSAAERARHDAADLLGLDPAELVEVARYPIRDALPALLPPDPVARPVAVGHGVFVVGDHRQVPSIQGALASGRRGAEAVLAHLGIGR